eukprot:1384529-Pleurochrysis_carterae.AAC.1
MHRQVRHAPITGMPCVATLSGVAPGSTSYTLRLADEAAYPPDIPREFAVTVAPAPGAMYVLSQPKSGKEKEQDSKRDGRSSSVVVEGKVELKGEVSAASLSKEYKELMTKRREQAEKRPEVQVLWIPVVKHKGCLGEICLAQMPKNDQFH